MRTLFFALSFFISLGILCGQTINLDQTGNGHKVKIHQIGDNTINIQHSGTSQSADVYQDGELNLANIKQLSVQEGYTSTSNSVLITQIGNDNMATIDQLRASFNYGGITQNGDRNKAAIEHGDGDWPTSNNKVDIYQYGNDNESFVNQGASQNQAETMQKGFNNRIEISMNNSELNPAENMIFIIQEGNGNKAKQWADAPGGYGIIEQIGNDNSVYQNLSATGNISGAVGEIIQRQNNAVARQFVSGLNGYGRIFQASSDPLASNYNEQSVIEEGIAIANVYGNYNYGSQIQYGRMNGSHIEERGMHNTSTTIQNESSSANIETSDLSFYNNMLINQNADWGYNHSASINMDGSYNIIEILQGGENNAAGLNILGDNIETHIQQMGTDLTVNISQEN